MHSYYHDIFTILRQSLFLNNQENQTVSLSPDWPNIFQELQAHAVSSLSYTWLKTHTISDPNIQNKWKTSCLQQQARWLQVMHAQDQLIALMEQHKIPFVIIKGAAAMMAYPQPSMRTAGDVDFLVKREDYDKAAIILENNGYHLEQEKNTDVHHYGYEKNGISFELHKRLAIITNADEKLLTLFEKGIDNREWHKINNFCFPTLPVDLNGLVLLFHINQHLRGGIGLRQIIDWMMYIYINQNLNEIIPTLRITGMEKLAKTVTVMCQKYLGLPKMIEDSNDYPTDELMEYIVNQGNFGQKDIRKDEKIAKIMYRVHNPLIFFSGLQKGGLNRWQAAQKHKILRPFAWCYQILSISHELIISKTSPNDISKAILQDTLQHKLIYKLGLDEDRNIK